MRIFIFTHILESVLDLFFPVRCIGCQAHNEAVCCRCLSGVPIGSNQACPRCGLFSLRGAVCDVCAPVTNFSGAWVVASYHDTLVQPMLKDLKYRGVTGFVPAFGRLAQRFVSVHEIKQKFDVLVPVPLHRKKLLQRGFNQAELLARAIQPFFAAIPIEDILERRRLTRPQYFLNRQNREKNLAAAFALKPQTAIAGKSILLIDDILTTGNTLNTCAAELRRAGAKEVWCLVWARG